MARWSHRTLLHPDQWAQIVGVEACAWNGVAGRGGCELWYQRPWQYVSYKAGRETVGQAILQAEEALARRLGFYVAPRYVLAEDVRWPEHGSALALQHGYIQAVGVEAREEIEIGAAIIYSGLTADDTATVTVTVDEGTDPCEVAAYYAGEVTAEITDDDETWRLRPQSVTVSGATATLVFNRCQMVLWEKHDAGEIVEVNDAAAFMMTVDVYRRYTDPRGAFAIWGDDCGGLDCAKLPQQLCGSIRNDRLSHVEFRPAVYGSGVWSAAAWRYCTRPALARVSYLAGWQDPTARDCERWGDLAEVVTKLALTKMRENICQCDQLSWLWSASRTKLEMFTRDVSAAYSMFGSNMAGALDAYVWSKERRIARGGTL